MKVIKWLKYLVYAVLIFFLVAINEYVGYIYNALFKQKFEINYCYIVIGVFLGVCIGMLLGLEHLLNETKKEGNWKINMQKLIVIGLPSLYFSLTFILCSSGINFLYSTLAYPLENFLRYGSNFVPLSQLILGYIIITSFKKYN